MNLYGKIFGDEGVERERKFETEAEAHAYVLGAQDAIECVDPENDWHKAAVDDTEAVDEDKP